MDNKNQQRLHRMGSQKMLPLIISFSLPSIISMTAMALYNVVDTIFVGRLGTNAIAGLTLIMPLQMFVLGFGLLIGVGTTSYISRSLGAQRYTVFRTITGPLMKEGLIAGAILAFARSLGETGATLMVYGTDATAPIQIVSLRNLGQFLQWGHCDVWRS